MCVLWHQPVYFFMIRSTRARRSVNARFLAATRLPIAFCVASLCSNRCAVRSCTTRASRKHSRPRIATSSVFSMNARSSLSVGKRMPRQLGTCRVLAAGVVPFGGETLSRETRLARLAASSGRSTMGFVFLRLALRSGRGDVFKTETDGCSGVALPAVALGGTNILGDFGASSLVAILTVNLHLSLIPFENSTKQCKYNFFLCVRVIPPSQYFSTPK